MPVLCPACRTEMFESEVGGMTCPSCGGRTTGAVTTVAAAPPRKASWLAVLMFFAAGGTFFAMVDAFQNGATFPWAHVITFVTALAMFIVACTGGLKRQLLSIVVTAVVAGIAWGADNMYVSSVQAPFEPHMNGYVTMAALDSETAGGSPRAPVVVIDVARRALDEAFFGLPDSIRAKRPADVASVVLVRCETTRIGTYGTSGGGAYQYTCDVRAYDAASKRLLARHAIDGPSPPSSSRNGVSQTGARPTGLVADYIRGLLR